MYSKKIDKDKFYTKECVALECINQVNIQDFDVIIEPSAGNGSFYNNIKHHNVIGIDILPEKDTITKMNWFDYKHPNFEDKILVIGNPPFGLRNDLSKKFIKHSQKINAHTIAFILPEVFKKHTLQKFIPKEYKIKLIYDIPKNSFLLNDSEYHVPCSFFVFTKEECECLRFDPSLYRECVQWRFSDKFDYDFFVMGASPNKLKLVPEKNNRGYFIKVNSPFKVEDVMKKFESCEWQGFSSVNGGVSWRTKPELVKSFSETYEKHLSNKNLSNFLK